MVDVLYWIEHVWSSVEYVCCARGTSERLDALSICFVCVFVCRKFSSSFRSLRTGSQVFALLMLFLCVILHTMSSCKRYASFPLVCCVCLPSV